MKKIPLSGKNGKGKFTLVDDEDFVRFGHIKWYIHSNGYAIRSTRDGKTRLHRAIMNTPENLVVDHLNGDRLDNRKSNLRICTQTDNMQNIKNVKGYSFDKARGKYIVKYRRKFYGRYDTEQEAAIAFKKACSGVEYVKKRRKLYYLPKGVTKLKNRYIVRPQINTKRIFVGSFKTIDEAVDALNKWKEERIES